MPLWKWRNKYHCPTWRTDINLVFIHHHGHHFRWRLIVFFEVFHLFHLLVHLLRLPLLLLSPLVLITIIMECEKTVLFFPYILITVFVVATREELMRHFIRIGIYKIMLPMPNSILYDCIFDGLVWCDWCCDIEVTECFWTWPRCENSEKEFLVDI